MFLKLYSELQCNHKDTSIVTATSLPLTVVCENFDPLSQSTEVRTTHLYENVPTASSPTHHQMSNIEMNQCTAYGVLTK